MCCTQMFRQPLQPCAYSEFVLERIGAQQTWAARHPGIHKRRYVSRKAFFRNAFHDFFGKECILDHAMQSLCLKEETKSQFLEGLKAASISLQRPCASEAMSLRERNTV